MADDAFHLTPLDIRRFDFGSALRGYDRLRVDQFRDQAANEVERLVKHVQNLEAKAQGFHEQLKAFRERDKAINEALISAQQLRAEIKEQADREAQLILREAKAEGDRVVADAHNEARRIESDIEALVRQRRSYLLQLRSLVERQMAELEVAESSVAPTPARGVHGAPPPPTSTPLWLDSVVKD